MKSIVATAEGRGCAEGMPVRSVVVTGIAVISAAGGGVAPFREALRTGKPLGEEREIALPRGKRSRIRVAPLGAWDAGEHLSPRELRKMAPESQAVCTAFMEANRDSGAPGRPLQADRVGTYLGSGFGCTRTTENYLRGIFTEGMATASPFLFSESLASSPLGHAAIHLDARGPSIALAGGDAAAVAAVAEGWREIRRGRIDRAICGGFELAGPTLIEVLARLMEHGAHPGSIGDGVAAFVLEEEKQARAGGAPLLARIVGAGAAGDPRARRTDWSHDPAAWAAAHDAAMAHAGRAAALAPPGGGAPPVQVGRAAPATQRGSSVTRIGCVYRHDPPSHGAAEAERRSIERLQVERGVERTEGVHGVFGSYAAAGGLSIAAAILACDEAGGPVLVSAGSWGGATAAIVIERA